MIPVFDTFDGVQWIDASTLFHQYNDACNDQPEFDISRVVEDLEPDDDLALHVHRVSGMLGVYGNITASTILHGLVGMMIAGSEDRINVVGDDAAIVTDDADITFPELKDAVNTCGEVHDEKFKTWMEDQQVVEEHQGWHYTKRPINRDLFQILQNWMPDFPIFREVLGQFDKMHTTPELQLIERRRLFIKQTCRLFQTLHRHSSSLSEEDIEVVLSVLEPVYLRLRLRLSGSFPSKHNYSQATHGPYPDPIYCTPALVRESIMLGWWPYLREELPRDGIITLPILTGEDPLPDEFHCARQFQSRGSKALALMEKIGVVHKERMTEDLTVTDVVIQRLHYLVEKKIFPVYRFTILRDYPPWASYVEFLQSSSLAPDSTVLDVVL